MRLAIPIESRFDPIQDRLVGESVGGHMKAAGKSAAEVVENGSAVMKKMSTRIGRKPCLGAGV